MFIDLANMNDEMDDKSVNRHQIKKYMSDFLPNYFSYLIVKLYKKDGLQCDFDLLK